MSDTRLYKVAITPKGKYVHGTEYDALCQVLNATEDGGDGCSYISLKPNKNVRPGTDDTVWAISLERGEKGDQGEPGSGFHYVEITVDSTSGNPSGTATISDDTLHLGFSGLKGEDGTDGRDGADGAPGTDGTDGKSAYEIAVDEGFVGTEEQWLASLKGEQGNTGSSVDYPYELVNNCTTNDATKGLSAAQGKVLKDEVTQLEAEVHNLSGKYYGLFTSSSLLPEGDDLGYAFVGSEAPFAIWNFDGDEWADTGATIDSVQGEPGADGVGFASVSTPTPADGTATITLSNGDTMTLDLNHNHEGYYSKVLGGAMPVGGFLPDVVYSLGTLSGAITFSLASPVTGNVNHYFWMFDTGVSAPTVTWPAGLTWADGSAPTMSASKHYEISVLGGVAYYSEI